MLKLKAKKGNNHSNYLNLNFPVLNLLALTTSKFVYKKTQTKLHWKFLSHLSLIHSCNLQRIPLKTHTVHLLHTKKVYKRYIFHWYRIGYLYFWKISGNNQTQWFFCVFKSLLFFSWCTKIAVIPYNGSSSFLTENCSNTKPLWSPTLNIPSFYTKTAAWK